MGATYNKGNPTFKISDWKMGPRATGRWHIRHMQLCTSGSKLLQRLEEPSAPQAALRPAIKPKLRVRFR